MFGQIDIEITLAPPGVLALVKAIGAAALAEILVANSEIGINIPAAAQLAAAIAVE